MHEAQCTIGVLEPQWRFVDLDGFNSDNLANPISFNNIGKALLLLEALFDNFEDGDHSNL
ncbi:hypothetical protein HF325_003817 [Metschnikowia pulcherrima]|uniref:Uncharacterized protein n=1 Tax=Metschnikowia pulcherrima TaxID=27326 RepID=A0A8H7L931_9ASCO|nr:hypothetical protein HF325_003817 [Metschnikowia pulcherrima]